MIARNFSRNASAEASSASSRSYRARTDSAFSLDGFRVRQAFVLHRDVQYFRVARVRGNRLPQYSHVPITPSQVLINSFGPAAPFRRDFPAAVDQLLFGKA
jgi:hypothetical protein